MSNDRRAVLAAISLLLLSIHWKDLADVAMVWLWGVVVFSVLSAVGYFRKFWRKVDDRTKLRRRRELLLLERRERRQRRRETAVQRTAGRGV